MTDKENKWIKFYPSLELPKERVSIAYDTHDERKIRYAYGYFQFHNGNCSSFWKDGNETPKVVKIEDIRYWMPVPSFDSMQEESGEIIDKYLYGKEPELVDDGDLPKEEPVNNDFEMALAEMIDKAQTSVVEPLVVAAQWKDELIKLAKSEEPVREIDFEQELYKAFGQVKDFTLGMRIAKRFYEMGRNHQEPVSEDLGEYINKLSKQFPEVSFAKLSRIAVRVSKWQKENLWKPADGDNLPIIDREVIALLDNGKVVFAHRPPEFWDGKDIVTGKVTRNYPKTYDKGGWNIPDVKWWLDVKLPKEIEL